MLAIFGLSFFLFHTFPGIISGALLDQHENCQYWASVGECDKNPNYMLVNCAKSCDAVSNKVKNNDIPNNFYSIVEKDINGNVINFEQFRGKIVYIVNVASQCGYTAENYEILQSLASLRSNKFEILIFPCNQFGAQEPGDAYQINTFAKARGFDGIIMSKGDVNGPNTRPTFQFLKQVTPKKHINWNFDGKFVVDQNGNVKTINGNVKNTIVEMLHQYDL